MEDTEMSDDTKKKLTVNLSPEIVEVLRQLAERDGTTMTEELKKAIAQRKYFLDKVDAGNEIQLVKEEDNHTTTTLVELV
jgi:hypothetical protein